MKNLWLTIMLIAIPLPAFAASDTAAFYYAECLQAAAIINAEPNADGSPNPSELLDPSSPFLHRWCTRRALEQARGGNDHRSAIPNPLRALIPKGTEILASAGFYWLHGDKAETTKACDKSLALDKILADHGCRIRYPRGWSELKGEYWKCS